MRWSRITHKEINERVLLSLEEVLEQGPSAKDASSETERITTRMSPTKRDILRSLPRLTDNKGRRPSMSNTMKLVVKCGVMRFQKKLLDTVFAHRRLLDVLNRSSRISGISVNYGTDIDSSLLGIFNEYRMVNKPSTTYLFRWTSAALGDVQEACAIGTFTAVVELVLSEAFASSTEIMLPEERTLFRKELAEFDRWMIKRSDMTIKSINTLIELGVVQEDNVYEDLILIESQFSNVGLVGEHTLPVFYDFGQ